MNAHFPRALPNHVALISVHLAEYQALTTSSIYSMYIQSTFWPILVGLVGLFYYARGSVNTQFLVWGAVAVASVGTVVFFSFLSDEYTTSRYIEQRLRPAVQSLLPDNMIWEHETWLANIRGRKPLWSEYLPLLAPVLAIVGAIGYTAMQTRADWFGLLLCVALFALAVVKAVSSVRIRVGIVQQAIPTSAAQMHPPRPLGDIGTDAEPEGTTLSVVGAWPGVSRSSSRSSMRIMAARSRRQTGSH